MRLAAIVCFTLIFTGMPVGPAIALDTIPTIEIDGLENDQMVSTDQLMCVNIALDAGDGLGLAADWWLLMFTPNGWQAYTFTDGWQAVEPDNIENLSPAYQGSLIDLPEFVKISCIEALATGQYYVYFGVDMTMNGRLDGDIVYDAFMFGVRASGSYNLVDTAQTVCYDDAEPIACPQPGDAFYGQDSQFSAGMPDYVDNGDGTVTDRVTGLMWQQSPDTDGDGNIDADDKLTYDQAIAGAVDLRLAGYADWRLPTIKELYSLIDFSGIDPSGYQGTDTSGLIPFIDTDYFDFAYGDLSAGERIIDAQYASATKYVSTTMQGDETLFGVNFADGRIKGYGTQLFGQQKMFYVIYVRGNSAYSQNDFHDNGDGTITDQATGLMWTREDSATGMTWGQALAWVAARNAENYLGHDDWRLPDVKELQSIVDYTRSPDTSASAAIDPVFNISRLTNEAGQLDYPYFWSGTTHANWSPQSGANAAYVPFGRAMGNMNGTWMDVHGAGAQRSDPKAGNPDDYADGHGPQGDAIRIYNYVRMVRSAG